MSTGTADGSLAGEGAWLLSWLGRRAVYIGETGRRLADRFREHRLDVLHKKSDLPVAQHFNSPGHSLEDVRVAVLKSGLARKDVRQREEMRQIFNFQTLAPRGINRDFSFI